MLLFFFLEDWVRIAKGLGRSLQSRYIDPEDSDAKLGWLLVVGTIPAGILGLLFDDAGPRPQLGQHAGEIVEQPGRAPHGARQVRRTGRICGVSTFSQRVCRTRSTASSNTVSEASAMCRAPLRTAARVASSAITRARPLT